MFCTNCVPFDLLDEIHEKVCMQIETHQETHPTSQMEYSLCKTF